MSFQISILLLICSSLIFWSGPDIPVLDSLSYQNSPLPVLAVALNIKTQPTDQTDCKGNKAIFIVTAEGGNGKIHYLWKRKRPSDPAFIAFGAADSMRLLVYNIGVGNEAPDSTLYQVAVKDAETEITSTPALLTVNQIIGISPVGIASYRLNQGENLWLKVLTSGNSPSGFQWIRKSGFSNWPDVKDGISLSGSQDAQLNFTEISPADSGIYKIRVTFPTINGNFCTETSTITRRIYVLAVPDTEPPIFIDVDNIGKNFCPDDLIQAAWSDSISGIKPDRDISCLFNKEDTLFDLSPTNFSDNITPSSSLILHWGIFYDDILHQPIADEAGSPLDDRTGQISCHPENIKFEDKTFSNQFWKLIFWLEDAAGNLTPVAKRHIITIGILRRPEIVSNF